MKTIDLVFVFVSFNSSQVGFLLWYWIFIFNCALSSCQSFCISIRENENLSFVVVVVFFFSQFMSRGHKALCSYHRTTRQGCPTLREDVTFINVSSCLTFWSREVCFFFPFLRLWDAMLMYCQSKLFFSSFACSTLSNLRGPLLRRRCSAYRRTIEECII